jgi:hypothetical protein
LKPILVASAALAAYLAWGSLGWPLIHDAPLMHYIAWVIGEGGVPYRDVFDMNLPGAYLIHALVIAVMGGGDLAWRMFDLGWLAATCGLLWVYARPLGTWPASAGALLFALYHLSGGAWRAGQRDFLLCAFLLAGALGVARSIEMRGALVPLAWAGLALGIGMTVKPHAGLFWLGAAASAGWGARRRWPVTAAATMLGAGLIAPALVFGWLAWRGAVGPFLSVFTGYVVPLYGQVGRVAVWLAFGDYQLGWGLWIAMAALAAVGAWNPAPGAEARKAIALMGVAAGAIHFAVQGKGWEYQLYPLAVFVCALVPFAVRRLTRESWETVGHPAMQPSAARVRHAGALALFAATVLVLGVKGVDALDEWWIGDKARRVAAVTRDLGRVAGNGATVQVLDVTEGGVHALWNLGLRQPTRFIYDFHFFHDTGDPRIQSLRAELVAGLRAAPPVAVVVLRDTWNRKGYDRFRDWPDLERILASTYRLAVDGDAYRIYARRADSS